MQEIILTVGGWIVGAAIAVFTGVVTMIFGKLKTHEEKHGSLDKRIDDHRLHVAENYAPKAELRDLKDTIVSHLVRIEDKLDKKADKV